MVDKLNTFFSYLNSIVIFLASIAVIVAAYVGYCTINEMKEQRLEMQEQRRSSYKPEITFLQKPDYVHTTEELTLGKLHKLHNVSLNTKKTLDPKDIEPLLKTLNRYRYKEKNLLHLHNIGNGPAKEFKVDWDLPTHEIADFINIKNKSDDFKAIFSRGSNNNYILFLQSGKLESHFSFSPDDSLKFVLPYSINEKAYKIEMPGVYFILLSLYFGAMDREELSDAMFQELPPLKAIVTYKDIGGKSHKVVFQSKFYIDSINFAESKKRSIILKLDFTKMSDN